ncbi:aspartate 1-decarboxylase [Marinicella meishanensis]|uniref:aspartate 1-decarboxylase n=1 Tax=Marinicella meishanensis TaxID=2873263 RepID=UPI001CBB0893|nr:aspartate 1-decarboxylase [Marinicella sp. NBU2979]
MNLTMLHSKIHRATVTDANLNYEGSVSICPQLIKAAGLLINQQIDVLNCNSGSRLTTYVIEGGPGEICLNGAAARHNQAGDLVILAAYCSMDAEAAKTHQPNLVFVDSQNQISSLKNAETHQKENFEHAA